MGEEQASISSPDRDVVSGHERWAYGEGWTAGLDEGRRQGFDEGYGVGFDVGANVGAARLLIALKAIVQGWSPDLHQQQRRPEGPATCRQQHPEGMR